MYEITEGRRATKGKSIMNYLSLSESEKVTSVLAMPKSIKQANVAIMMITAAGSAKKVDAKSFHDVRRSGIIAIKLAPKDSLQSVAFVEKGDTVMVAPSRGQSIRFKESDIRAMGRAAGGVRAVRLSKSDAVIGADVVKKDDATALFLVVMANGYGKTTNLKEYKVQRRGGSGIKTAKVNAKTGSLIASKVLTTHTEIVAISKKSQVIRVDAKEIPQLGRQTQGVRIMKLREGDSLASVTCL